MNRQVALTDGAAVLAREIAQALDRINAASARFEAQTMTGTIRIFVTPFYANCMILPYPYYTSNGAHADRQEDGK